MDYNALSLLLCVCSHTSTNSCGHSRQAETPATARFDSNLTTTNLQVCFKYYTYICVRILLVLLLYMCPHTAIYFMQYNATASPLMRFPRKKSHHQYHHWPSGTCATSGPPAPPTAAPPPSLPSTTSRDTCSMRTHIARERERDRQTDREKEREREREWERERESVCVCVNEQYQ